MSTVLGVNATKAADPSPDNLLTHGALGGNVKVMIDQYEAASLAANDLIQIGKALPTGARIVGISVIHDALGSGVTFDVGDADTVDRYIDGADGNTVSLKQINEADGLGYVIGTNTSDEVVYLKVLGAAATGTINVVIFYTHE